MVAKPAFEHTFKKRMVAVAVFFVLCLLFIIGRLASMQLLHNEKYQVMAEGQRTNQHQLMPTRGEIQIWDSFTNLPYTVATSSEKIMVYANPSQITDIEFTAQRLADLLNLSAEDIVPKISDSAKKYVVIKKDLSEAEQATIRDAKLTGINFDKEISRLYPERTLLAQLLGFVGFVGDERKGSYGLELAYNNELSGQPGLLLEEKDSAGRWIFGGKRDRIPAKDGDSVLLTIDKTIQFKVEAVLKDTVEKHSADSGSVVVMDPKTGAVIAMATYPTFDLNDYGKVPSAEMYSNQVTMGAYEPGSIFKPITFAAAINEGKITPRMTYQDTGEVKVDEYTIKNSDGKSYGEQTMSQVLEQSLNTGTIFVKDSIGNPKFKEYVERFGFGKKTGIEVLESTGNLANLRGNIRVNYHTASFGQGISVTPLQIVQAFSAIANGGVMTSPYVVQKIIRDSGELEDVSRSEKRQVISARTASEVAAMMVNVVENGHGQRAKVPGYYMAGKTGTAQVARKDGRGYQENNNIGSFVGFGPVEDPKFVILVRVNHPRTVRFAEATAAPAFGEIAQFLVQHYKIVPTRQINP
ncbi:MAG TPA: penicillin-binding protein 2 [Candidatus Doudnabacteria bacterium]|nr:penicillin-binding protein 2 [Candidatus Doudnabacteria bacterium]